MSQVDGNADQPAPVASDSPPRRPFPYRILMLAIFAVLVAAFYFSGLSNFFSWTQLKAHRDAWRHEVDTHFTLAAIVFFFTAIALMSLSLPVGSILSLAAGAMFDLWWGVAIINVASTIGATFAFLSSRYLFHDFVRRWFGRWLKGVDRGIERDGASYLLMLRLSPVVPFFAVNATMGLTKIRVGTFIWISQIGMLPSSFLYVLAGTQLMQIESPKDILSVELIAILSMLAIAPLVLKWVFRKRTAA